MYYILTYKSNKKIKLRLHSVRLHFSIILLLVCLGVADALWHQRMDCISHDSSTMVLLGAGLIGAMGGTLWGIFVGKVLPMSRYMLPSGTKICWSPTQSIYRCREANALGSLL
jgi:nitrate/nitrite transporter NarK